MNTGADDESLSTPTLAFNAPSQRASESQPALSITPSSPASNIRDPPGRQRGIIRSSPLVTNLGGSADPARERRLVLSNLAAAGARRYRAGPHCRLGPAPRQFRPLPPSQSRRPRRAPPTARHGSSRRSARPQADCPGL